MSEITYNQLSELTGKGYRTVRRLLVDAGVEPVRRKGTSVLFDSVIALEAIYLHRKEGESLDLTAERAKLASEQHREKKRQNDVAEGEVAPLAVLGDALTKVGLQIVALMESLPLEMKRANPRLTSHDIVTVRKTIHKVCDAVSRIQLES